MSEDEQAYYKRYFEKFEKARDTAEFNSTNFMNFKNNRHNIRTEAEKKAEREANYKKFEAKEDSNFHTINRGFSSKKFDGNIYKAMLRGFNPF
jgi:hypothetical protein